MTDRPNPHTPSAAAKPAKPRAHPESKTIATGLKSLYRTVVEEPIPDDLMDLLDSLDKLDGSTKP